MSCLTHKHFKTTQTDQPQPNNGNREWARINANEKLAAISVHSRFKSILKTSVGVNPYAFFA
jgi:hypothetical protein